MHRSFNPVTHEHNIDNFNIDWIRYFSKKNIVGNLVGSVIAAVLFFRFRIYDRMIVLEERLLWIYLIGICAIFLVMLFLSMKAGNNVRSALHMVVRRGLFSYIEVSAVLIAAIFISGAISFTDEFGRLFYMFIAGQIFFAILALPLDFLATFSLKD